MTSYGALGPTRALGISVNDPRDARLVIRMTPAEKARIEQLTARDGLPASTWARRVLLRESNHLEAQLRKREGR